MTPIEKPNTHKQAVNKLIKLVGSLLVMVALALFVFIFTLVNNFTKNNSTQAQTQKQPDTQANTKADEFWKPLIISDIENKEEAEKIKYGKELVAHTSLYFGPKGSVISNLTNGMNCQNCHLDAGTKTFGNNYSLVASTYPKYRARSGQKEGISKRVNDCFERSLNGKPLDTTSKEMQAMVAYIQFLGKNVPKGTKPEGAGLKKIPFLDRPINPENGKIAYEQKCASCHQLNGQGVLNPDGKSYSFPPLWGKNSYNDGAGLYRMSNFAYFIKYNMPLGASHNAPTLTNEEAWDIAAFVNTQTRPKKDISHDWPNIAEKPFDHPFGPYKDGFSEEQHKFGPYEPIQNKIKKLVAHK